MSHEEVTVFLGNLATFCELEAIRSRSRKELDDLIARERFYRDAQIVEMDYEMDSRLGIRDDT